MPNYKWYSICDLPEGANTKITYIFLIYRLLDLTLEIGFNVCVMIKHIKHAVLSIVHRTVLHNAPTINNNDIIINVDITVIS